MYTERESLKKKGQAEPPARLAVMAINPYSLHAYWQISGKVLEDIQDTFGESLADARPVLRFYDITCVLFDGANAHQIFDVEVDLRTMNWNVPIWSADKSYLIDLAYKASDGRFYKIARSNVIRVPRAGPSPWVAERYLRVERGQMKDLLPVPVEQVPRRKPLEAPRLDAVHGMRKETWQAFKGEGEQVRTGHPARTKQSEETGIIPCQMPDKAIGEKQGPVGDVLYPVDLVQLTEERFSFGVSSPAPSQGANARGD